MRFRINLMTVSAASLILAWATDALRGWSGLKRHVVQVDRNRWVYLDGGKGAPIVFIHGFGADKDRFWTFLPAFSKTHRLVVPDLPGFGESSKPLSEGYDIPSQVKRLNRFLETIGLDSFHLFGISMGGYVCGYYAAEYPEKLRSLALMDAAGVKSRRLSYAMSVYEQEGRNLLLYKTVREFEELISVLFHSPPWIPGPFKRYFARQGALNYEFYSKILKDIMDGGINLLDHRLSEISARTLVIWGANDRIVDVSSVEEFAGKIPNCRSEVIQNCGHVPYFEKPREAKRIYREFLEGLGV